MDWLAVSNILLWGLVVFLTVVVLALARQIGVLNDRVAPAGALTPTSGPKIGNNRKNRSNKSRRKPLNIGGTGRCQVVVGLIHLTDLPSLQNACAHGHLIS